MKQETQVQHKAAALKMYAKQGNAKAVAKHFGIKPHCIYLWASEEKVRAPKKADRQKVTNGHDVSLKAEDFADFNTKDFVPRSQYETRQKQWQHHTTQLQRQLTTSIDMQRRLSRENRSLKSSRSALKRVAATLTSELNRKKV